MNLISITILYDATILTIPLPFQLQITIKPEEKTYKRLGDPILLQEIDKLLLATSVSISSFHN
jgi:hypothetical protein